MAFQKWYAASELLKLYNEFSTHIVYACSSLRILKDSEGSYCNSKPLFITYRIRVYAMSSADKGSTILFSMCVNRSNCPILKVHGIFRTKVLCDTSCGSMSRRPQLCNNVTLRVKSLYWEFIYCVLIKVKYTNIFWQIHRNIWDQCLSWPTPIDYTTYISTAQTSLSLQSVILPDSIVHGACMGPTWVLSAPDGPHVGPMNLAIRAVSHKNGPFLANGWRIIAT